MATLTHVNAILCSIQTLLLTEGYAHCRMTTSNYVVRVASGYKLVRLWG